MKQVFQILIALLLPIYLIAQPSNSILDDVAMPAPNAASLGQYADVPVNYSTGVPSIGIPIYTVKEGNLSLPISLSYHAGGLKVGQPASWIGQGWSLNAGGMITRTVIGLPDEQGVGYYNSGATLDQSDTEIEEVANGEMDSEPDIFSFNVGGFTGKFVFDENQKPFLMPKQDIRIEVNYGSNQFKGFTLIAPNGTRYIFGNLPGQSGLTAIERTHFSPASLSSHLPHHSSWYLNKIISYDLKDTISLTYEEELYSFKSLSSCSFTKLFYYCNGSNNQADEESCSGFSDNGGYTYYNRISIGGKRLKTITNSSGTTTVTFVKGTQFRKDLDSIPANTTMSVSSVNTAYPLSEIEVDHGTKSQKWTLYTSFFESTTPGGKAENFRLKLDSLQQEENGTGTEQIPPYKFTYEGPTNGNGSKFLPGRIDKAVDHWGYYNGRTTNNNHFGNAPPTVTLYGGLDYLYGESIRHTDTSFLDYGVLNSIEHPLGGIERFYYEPHDHYTTLNGVEKLLYLENCEVFEESCCSSSGQTAEIVFYDSLEIEYADFILYLKATDNVICDSGFPDPDHCLSCSYESSHSVTISAYDLDNSSSVGSPVAFNVLTGYDTISYDLDEIGTFEPGVRYRFTLDVDNGRGSFELFSDYGSGVSANRPVGGLRVAKIRVSPYGSLGGNDIIRTFAYRDSTNQDRSSGFLHTLPLYKVESSFSIPSGTGYMIHVQDDSNVPLGGFNGNHISYERVQEYFNGNGRKDYDFNPGSNTTSLTFPIIPSLFDVDDGELRGSYTFNENDELVQRSRRFPGGNSAENMSGLAYKVMDTGIRCIIGGDSSLVKGTFLDEDYVIQTSSYLIGKEVNETDGLEVVTEYTYGNSDYLNPSEIETTNSDGTTSIQKMKYAYDLDSTVYNTMVSLNMVSIPIQTTREVAGTQVSGSRSLYRFFNRTTGHPSTVPSPTAADSFLLYPGKTQNYEYTWDSTGTPSITGWKTERTIDEVNVAIGRPEEITNRGWETEFLTWDESRSLPLTWSYENFDKSYTYHTNSQLVSTMTDIDDQVTSYSYDDLLRLTEANTRGGNAETRYEYHFREPTDTFNYVKTIGNFTSVTGSDFTGETTFQYVDGLGRPIQSVIQQHSTGQKDVITVTEYDQHSRPIKNYEPFASANSTGAYVSSIPGGTEFTETTYESSPLSRKKSVTPPDWYATNFGYGTNSSSVTIAGTMYSANTLKIDTIQDPNGNYNITYSDRWGRKLRMRKMNSAGTSTNDTEYLYDDKDRLDMVVPPGATTTSDGLTYRYTYDGRDNVVYKWIPDQGRHDFLYNERALMAATRDPNMRSDGKWIHTHFDDYGRNIATGFVNQSGILTVSSNQTFSDSLSRTWYDGAGIPGSGTIYNGKVSRGRERILGTNDWIDTRTYYDSYGRVDKTRGNHHLRLTDFSAEITEYTYDFADNVLKEDRDHREQGGDMLPIINEMTYDHAGRQEDHTISIDGQTEHLSTQTYTVKDELKEKDLGIGTSTVLQSMDYEYLENGFLSSMNPGTSSDGDWFSFSLYYDDQPSGISPTIQDMFNGNIATMVWRHGTGNYEAYGYSYDYLDRLEEAYLHRKSPSSSSFSTNTPNRLTTIEYEDGRGNIKNIERYNDGYTRIDDITYTYSSGTNKISSLTDSGNSVGFDEGSGGSYDYDKNGNLTDDPYKDLLIAYNHLNLPDTIKPGSGSDSLVFLYTAGGSKLRKKLIETGGNTIQDYIGGIEYTNSTVDAIYHAEGRAVKDGSTWDHEYVITDHLGNTRVRFHDDNGNGTISSGELLSTHDYYPFGMEWNAGSYQYTYNGKERNDELGLDWLDYGARMYDPTIARWVQVDPMAELTPNWTPYRYGFNNPIRYHDPTGLFEIDEQTANDHPELVEYLKGLVDFWKNQSDDFKNEFMEKSGLTNDEVVEMLTYGQGPKLSVENIDNDKRKANGVTLAGKDEDGNLINANDGKGHIKIDDDVIALFEQGRKDPDPDVAKVTDLLLESTLFHESTHYGNLKTDNSGNGKFEESGKAFEDAVYGGDVDRSPIIKRMWDVRRKVTPLPPQLIYKVKSKKN